MMGSKSPVLFYGRLALLAAGVLYTLLCRYMAGAGEWYARQVYPVVSGILSAMSSVVPFSLEEWLVVAAVSGLLLYPVLARRHKKSWKRIAGREAEGLLWLYVWFYWGWGINYYRDSFFQRTATSPRQFEKAAFMQFLTDYTDSLHACYTADYVLPRDSVQKEVRRLFASLPQDYGLTLPRPHYRPKRLLLNGLYSQVGVLGFMGPFFSEMQLNEELLPAQYAFTYAHELSHLLGVSNEAEANFWAYYLCSRSPVREIRSSAYFGLLPYVAVNARYLTDKAVYTAWIKGIDPLILKKLDEQQAFWQSRYNPYIGLVQEKLYHLYLKGNRISSGQKNYSEVVALVMAFCYPS